MADSEIEALAYRWTEKAKELREFGDAAAADMLAECAQELREVARAGRCQVAA